MDRPLQRRLERPARAAGDVRGQELRRLRRTVAIRNWLTGAWTALDTRTAGTTVAVVDRAAGGTLADLVSGTTGTGEVRVRVTGTSTTTSFTTAGDLLRVTATL